LELLNVSQQTVSLTGVTVTSAVEFDFSQSPQQELAPAQRILLVQDLAAFQMAYPQANAPVAGVYEGSLSNTGETIRILGRGGQVIQEVTFDDDVNTGWPQAPDGNGPSLQAINPGVDCGPSNCNWRPSAVAGGTPGDPAYPVGDSNLDRVFDSSDLVQVFQAGRYETPAADDATWAQGDWNGDRDFDSSDLVMAFQSGMYEVAAPPASAAGQVATSTVQPHGARSLPEDLPPAPPHRGLAFWRESRDKQRRRIRHLDTVFQSPNIGDETSETVDRISAARVLRRAPQFSRLDRCFLP
jgi:hypothetical protein